MSQRHLFALFYALGVVPHICWAAALSSRAGLWVWGAGALLAWLTCWRVARGLDDSPRARWVTRFVDEPVLAHWAGGALALALFAPVWAGSRALPDGWQPASVLGIDEAASAWLVAYLTGLGIAVWGTWVERRRLRIRRFEIAHPLVAPALDGYRIAHLSDLHIGSFDRRETGLKWARRANALCPNLTVVTGDLVTRGTEFYPAVCDVLAALEAADGCYVVLGNHDRRDAPELARQLRRRGIAVLQNEWVMVESGGRRLLLAGLDDGDLSRANPTQALANAPRGLFTLLLSHHPAFLDEAARRGVPLMLSGHTHGGQIGIPLLADRLNIATLFGHRAGGRFESNGTTLLVSTGLGCTGPPLRLGVRPEVGLVVLRSPGNADRGSSQQPTSGA